MGTHDDPDWLTKFMIIVWYIWKWRCTEEIPREKEVFLLNKFREILHALQQESQVQCTINSEHSKVWVRWEPPLGRWMVLNTAGAAKGNPGPAGTRGVITGDKSEWVIGFCENLGHCSSIKVELKVVFCGLKLAKEMHAQRIWIQINSSVVVSMLTSQKIWHPEYSFLLQQCKHVIEWEGWEVKISHCFREANQVADMLAKMVIEGMLGLTIYRVPLVETRDALYVDSVGVSWPRHVSR